MEKGQGIQEDRAGFVYEGEGVWISRVKGQ